MRRATKKAAVFHIRDFQIFLNDTLLPSHGVKPWKGAPSSKIKGVEKESRWLQVSLSCALAWALRLGLKYTPKRKSYYVDGHDRADVLEYRAKWLALELHYELRQYLWVQLPLKKAVKMEVNVDGQTRSLFDALLMSTVAGGTDDAAEAKEGEKGGAESGGEKEEGEDKKTKAKVKRDRVLAASFAKEMVFHYHGDREGRKV